MRDPSPYAGQTVKLKADAAELGGRDVEVQDWFSRVRGRGWKEALAGNDPRAVSYNVRRGLGGLPDDDDDVLLGRVDGMGQIVHLSEVEGSSATPTSKRSGPKLPDDRAIGQPCPACGVRLERGDQVAMVLLGPGTDPAARAKARAGQPYEAVATELHWACATGVELPAGPKGM